MADSPNPDPCIVAIPSEDRGCGGRGWWRWRWSVRRHRFRLGFEDFSIKVFHMPDRKEVISASVAVFGRRKLAFENEVPGSVLLVVPAKET